MSKLSACLNLPAIILESATIVGYIKNVYFDKISQNFAYFCIINDDGQKKRLPVDKAICAKDAILIEDKTALADGFDDDALQSVAGMAAYTRSGTFKGNVTDAQFSSAGKPVKFFVDGGEISPSQIATFGDVILLKAAPARRKNAKLPRPKQDSPVYILENQAALQRQEENGSSPIFDDVYPAAKPAVLQRQEDNNSSPIFDEVYSSAKPAVALSAGEPMFSQGALNKVIDGASPLFAQEDSHTPTRVICDYEFLLGRTLGADLKSYAGELLASRGEEVTAATVERARAHGKLVELTLNSARREPK